MIAERTTQFPEYAGLIEAYGQRFLETIPERVAGTAQLIERLHVRGVPLFAITNFGADFWAQYRPTESVLDLFRDIVVSGHERMIKPDAAIFRLAQNRFGARPADMLFIDDNAANIDAASALGWHVHHFRDAAQLEVDLTQRGLL